MRTASLFFGLSFLAAAALFAVQPLAGRLLLPATGGSPATWLASQVFFLASVPLAYGLALVLLRLLSVQRATLVAGIVLAAWGALALASPSPLEMRLGDGPAETAILATLTLVLAVPILGVSALSPLLGRWWAQVHPERAYRLWVPGNLGALASLLLFPFVIEPLLDLSVQRAVWAALVLVIGAGVVALALIARRRAPAAVGDPAGTTTFSLAGSGLGARRLSAIVGLAALLVALSLAITDRLSLEIAPGPLTWVGPLAVYLLAFAVAFSDRRRPTRLARIVAPAAILVLLASASGILPHGAALVLVLAAWLPLAIALAGRLAELRPAGPWLPHYSLLIALGGLAGGIVIALLAPVVLDRYLELEVCLLLAGIVLLGALRARRPLGAGRSLGALLLIVATVITGASIVADVLVVDPEVSWRGRSRWAAYEVREDGQDRWLIYGNTLHGSESLDPARRELAGYYWGIGPLVDTLATEHPRVGVIGLGVGDLALLADDGARVRFWEIDPLVETIARDRFGLLSGAPTGAVDVRIADGRFGLADEPDGAYDLFVGDAYASDAVPLHLLTTEGLAEQARLVADEGWLLVHVSNRHLDLARMVGRAAHELGWRAWSWILDPGDAGDGRYEAWWVLIDPSGERIPDAGLPGVLTPLEGADGPAWSDERSPLLWALPGERDAAGRFVR